MYLRLTIAAGLTSALLMAAMSTLPANAGPLHDTFCKGSTPTPQHVCDTIKSAEKNKPASATGQLQVKQAGAKQLKSSSAQRAATQR